MKTLAYFFPLVPASLLFRPPNYRKAINALLAQLKVDVLPENAISRASASPNATPNINAKTTAERLSNASPASLENNAYKSSSIPSNTPLLTQLYEKSEGYDAVAFIHPASCFYNKKANETLLGNMNAYHADIGFGENFPVGMVFEVARRETLPVLENVRQQNRIEETPSLIEKLVAVDVNAFVLENLYAEGESVSALRLNFCEDCAQNQFTAQKVLKLMRAKNADKPLSEWLFADIALLIQQNLAALKTIPSFYEWHIAFKGGEGKSYCPLNPSANKNPLPLAALPLMDYNSFLTMLSKTVHFSKTCSMALSAALGEPTTHRQWKDFVAAILRCGVPCLLETDGLLISESEVKALMQHPLADKLRIVFMVGTINPRTYKKLHGKALNDGLIRKIENLMLEYPHNIYVEVVKTEDTIDDLQFFYNHFSRFSKNIIISKYNTFRGYLPERRSRVMEPLHPIACWHLKRDVVIDSIGDVWLCKQDIKKEHRLGNLLRDDMQTIFDAGKIYYEKHLAKFSFCEGCDEYYTYNF